MDKTVSLSNDQLQEAITDYIKKHDMLESGEYKTHWKWTFDNKIVELQIMFSNKIEGVVDGPLPGRRK